MAEVINRFGELAEKQDIGSDVSFEKAISETVESAVQVETCKKVCTEQHRQRQIEERESRPKRE